MSAFIFCAAVGALQTALLSIVLKGALGGKMKQTLIALFLKMLVYGIGFTILYFFFLDNIFYAAAGLIAGVIASFPVVAIKSFKKLKSDSIDKGDDVNGHGGAD